MKCIASKYWPKLGTDLEWSPSPADTWESPFVIIQPVRKIEIVDGQIKIWDARGITELKTTFQCRDSEGSPDKLVIEFLPHPIGCPDPEVDLPPPAPPQDEEYFPPFPDYLP